MCGPRRSELAYVGAELELFAAATNWKQYVRRRIAPYMGSRVLEVGAGLGATAEWLCGASRTQWICLEPDASLAARAAQKIREGVLPACCQVVTGVVDDLPPARQFETVLYMDVLEHIQDDRREIDAASRRLASGGHLIVLAPAHQWLFTEFDRAIGHHRRYTRRTLRDLAASELQAVKAEYLDSVGMLASLANRVVLKSALPTVRQLAVWDKVLVRCSRLMDPLLGFNVGKSVLVVWRRGD